MYRKFEIVYYDIKNVKYFKIDFIVLYLFYFVRLVEDFNFFVFFVDLKGWKFSLC